MLSCSHCSTQPPDRAAAVLHSIPAFACKCHEHRTLILPYVIHIQACQRRVCLAALQRWADHKRVARHMGQLLCTCERHTCQFVSATNGTWPASCRGRFLGTIASHSSLALTYSAYEPSLKDCQNQGARPNTRSPFLNCSKTGVLEYVSAHIACPPDASSSRHLTLLFDSASSTTPAMSPPGICRKLRCGLSSCLDLRSVL